MRVQLQQVIPGCILVGSVKGKTNRPIIPKNTVLTTEHIKILNYFLVEEIDVSRKLANGKAYTPSVIRKENKLLSRGNSQREMSSLSFEEHYDQVVLGFRKIFKTWQNSVPIDMPALRKLLLPLIERTADMNNAIYTLHNRVEKKNYFFHHSVSVAILSAYLAHKLGYPKKEWMQIGLAGLLADAGMAKLDENIITKVGPLTDTELKEVRRHPVYSYQLIEHIPTVTKAVKLAVLQHHERMNKSGYPLGLTEDKIHNYAKIIAVCDTFHAMVCERFYQERQSLFKAIEELHNEQFSRLDPKIVQTFIRAIANYSIGAKVLLSNNEIGEVVYTKTDNPTSPIIRLENSGELITLQENNTLFIKDIL